MWDANIRIRYYLKCCSIMVYNVLRYNTALLCFILKYIIWRWNSCMPTRFWRRSCGKTGIDRGNLHYVWIWIKMVPSVQETVSFWISSAPRCVAIARCLLWSPTSARRAMRPGPHDERIPAPSSIIKRHNRNSNMQRPGLQWLQSEKSATCRIQWFTALFLDQRCRFE